LSRFRQITTSLKRLLAFIRLSLDCTGRARRFSTRCFVPPAKPALRWQG